MVLYDLGVFIVSCLALILAGNILIRSLIKISAFLRINEFTVAFILMAFGTSVPELFVGISSALQNQPALILGTIIGSNIVNLSLIGGVAALLSRGIKITKNYIKKDAYWMIAFSMLPIVLMAIGKELSRIDAIILLIAFFTYIIMMIKTRREKQIYENNTGRWATLGYFLLFIISFPLLFYSAEKVVTSGLNLSMMLALPPIFIGLFFISLGTSLPELFVSATASIARQPNIILGNLIGSSVVNSTLILAITALITPITANVFLFVTSSMFMLVISLLFAIFIDTSKGINWKEGIGLIMMYVLFLIVELNLKGYYFG